MRLYSLDRLLPPKLIMIYINWGLKVEAILRDSGDRLLHLLFDFFQGLNYLAFPNLHDLDIKHPHPQYHYYLNKINFT